MLLNAAALKSVLPFSTVRTTKKAAKGNFEGIQSVLRKMKFCSPPNTLVWYRIYACLFHFWVRCWGVLDIGVLLRLMVKHLGLLMLLAKFDKVARSPVMQRR